MLALNPFFAELTFSSFHLIRVELQGLDDALMLASVHAALMLKIN